MTREEAITVLKAFMENPLFSDEHKQAFNIAIHDIKQRHDWDINNLILINKDDYEPLEQELCENTVSVQTVLDMLEDINAETDGVGFYYEHYVEYVKNLPSVQPKRGHWIPTYGNIKCSVCGSVKDSREVGKATHYCDFCGAKMESEE